LLCSLHLYAARRYLHPFPTRRSSDLTQPTFFISGHGWGHGLGMSQYGAYGYAQHGWTYDRILKHYYTGTTIGQAPVSRVRVLLLDRKSTRLNSSHQIISYAVFCLKKK